MVSKRLLFHRRQHQLELVELCLVNSRRCVKHHVAARVVLGEGDAVADTVETCKEAHEAVKTIGQTTMRWCSVLEGIHEEAKLLLGLLRSKAKHLEDLGLKDCVVDTDRATADLNTVAHHIIGIGQHRSWVGVELGNVAGLWSCERMVHGHEALLLVAPLKHWEVYDPQKGKLILVTQAKAVTHQQAQLTELLASFHGIGTADDEDEVALLEEFQELLRQSKEAERWKIRSGI